MLAGDFHTQLVAAGARLAAAGLVRDREGNLSVRVNSGTCLVTPTGGVTGRLSGADMVEVSLRGGVVPARATSEVWLHLEIYRRRPDVGAIVHAHPPQVLRLAGSGRLPEPRFLDGDERLLHSVIDVPYFEEGSRTLATTAAKALDNATACVLRGHGAVTVGPDIETALQRLVFLERAAARTRGE